MKNVMFVCRESTYSKMAEAWMHKMSESEIQVSSSYLGMCQVKPQSIAVMDEVDLDIRNIADQPLDNFHPKNFDTVIALSNTKMELDDEWMLRRTFDEWSLPEIEDESLDSFRQVRDAIKDRVELLLMIHAC
ncbi:MAG: ArsC family transcriptional regulator [Pseudanabaena sp.]|nr:MAG: ArsC family transcriptional regulator [Pseudanabaena sp.]